MSMATFKAINVGLLFALTAEGFEPAGKDRVKHPTLTGREAKRAFQRAWEKAIEAAKLIDPTAGIRHKRCVTGSDPDCDCKGYGMEPFGRLINANLNV
jgi:hypothetical protein